MDARRHRYDARRGAERLVAHCVAFGGLDQARPTALERLEALVGGDLARLLVYALAGNHAMRAPLIAY